MSPYRGMKKRSSPLMENCAYHLPSYRARAGRLCSRTSFIVPAPDRPCQGRLRGQNLFYLFLLDRESKTAQPHAHVTESEINAMLKTLNASI